MSGDRVEAFALLPRAVDNSGVKREMDPRASRNMWRLLGLVFALVAGMVLFAWPRLEAQRLDDLGEQLQRRRERLLEQGRKLRLEKASLENLERVDVIARRDLGLATPETGRIFVASGVVPPTAQGAQVASAPARETARPN